MKQAHSVFVILEGDIGKSLDDVALWLVECTKPAVHYEASELYRVGLERGWSENKIRSAGKDLGFIMTKRPGFGNKFWWIRPSPNHHDSIPQDSDASPF